MFGPPVAPLQLQQTSEEGLYRLARSTSKSGLETPSTPTHALQLIRVEIGAAWIYTLKGLQASGTEPCRWTMSRLSGMFGVFQQTERR